MSKLSRRNVRPNKRWSRWLAFAITPISAAVLLPTMARSTAAAATNSDVVVSNYTDASVSAPEGITAGPDGALWFTNFDNNSIGRITTSGTITNFTDPSVSGPDRIAVGPDGALWFTQDHFPDGPWSIGRITTSGTITSYTNASVSAPQGITAGPDGALWFVNALNNSIGRITTSGIITNFTDPSISDPMGITAGPDGALWFTNSGGTGTFSIGRITTSGKITHFTDPSIYLPQEIVAGPDGALWFTNKNSNIPGAHGSVGRITTDGTVTSYTDPTMMEPWAIAAGPDGALWFTNVATINGVGISIGRITTAGTVTNFTGLTGGSIGVAAGPDAAMWFTTTSRNSIGRLTFAPPKIVPGRGSVVEGNTGTRQLSVPVTLSHPSMQTVSAQWHTVCICAGSAQEADPSSDYTPASGTVTFAPGETQKSVPITVNGDTLVEPDEAIIVQLTNPTNATIGGLYGLGFGVIKNDDHATVVPTGGSVVKPTTGTATLPISVSLSNPSTQTVTAQWNTVFLSGASAVQATPQVDYTPASGTVTFAPGQTMQTVTAQWNTVFLSGASGVQATPQVDYTPASGTVTFAPGQTMQTVPIAVTSGVLADPYKIVVVSFHNATNATIGGYYGLAFGFILGNTAQAQPTTLNPATLPQRAIAALTRHH